MLGLYCGCIGYIGGLKTSITFFSRMISLSVQASAKRKASFEKAHPEIQHVVQVVIRRKGKGDTLTPPRFVNQSLPRF